MENIFYVCILYVVPSRYVHIKYWFVISNCSSYSCMLHILECAIDEWRNIILRDPLHACIWRIRMVPSIVTIVMYCSNGSSQYHTLYCMSRNNCGHFQYDLVDFLYKWTLYAHPLGMHRYYHRVPMHERRNIMCRRCVIVLQSMW